MRSVRQRVVCSVCSVQGAVRSVQCAVCSVQCEVCSVQCAARSVSAQCGVWSVECGVWSAQCAVLVRLILGTGTRLGFRFWFYCFRVLNANAYKVQGVDGAGQPWSPGASWRGMEQGRSLVRKSSRSRPRSSSDGARAAGSAHPHEEQGSTTVSTNGWAAEARARTSAAYDAGPEPRPLPHTGTTSCRWGRQGAGDRAAHTDGGAGHGHSHNHGRHADAFPVVPGADTAQPAPAARGIVGRGFSPREEQLRVLRAELEALMATHPKLSPEARAQPSATEPPARASSSPASPQVTVSASSDRPRARFALPSPNTALRLNAARAGCAPARLLTMCTACLHTI